jgi:hypothetical protein
MKDLIPIAIFVFDRPDILQETLDALSKNQGIEKHQLIFFCDGPCENENSVRLKNIEKVYKVIESIKWSKDVKVFKKSKNFGLANSIVNGVSQVLNDYENVIVLEDDIKTSPFFLKYMRDSLLLYKNNLDVVSISGFNYPLENINVDYETFFLKGTDCWGWATWQRGWAFFEPDAKILLRKINEKKIKKHFDFNGNYKFSKMLKKTIRKNHSWAVKWYASAYLANKYTLYPVKSLVKNIGDKGTNVKQNNLKMLGHDISMKEIVSFEIKVEQSEFMYAQISNHFAKYYNIFYRIHNFLEQKIKKNIF